MSSKKDPILTNLKGTIREARKDQPKSNTAHVLQT